MEVKGSHTVTARLKKKYVYAPYENCQSQENMFRSALFMFYYGAHQQLMTPAFLFFWCFNKKNQTPCEPSDLSLQKMFYASSRTIRRDPKVKDAKSKSHTRSKHNCQETGSPEQSIPGIPTVIVYYLWNIFRQRTFLSDNYIRRSWQSVLLGNEIFT